MKYNKIIHKSKKKSNYISLRELNFVYKIKFLFLGKFILKYLLFCVELINFIKFNKFKFCFFYENWVEEFMKKCVIMN